MTILAEILDRVKKGDEESFRLHIEAKEAESKKFVNEQGMETIQDIIDRRLAAEQMTFKIDEDHGSPLLKGPDTVEGQATPTSSSAIPDSGSEIYKKFLDQLK
jgi:hypothetical protein